MTNYAVHPLDYSIERVRRAEEHLADLRDQIKFTFRRQSDAAPIYFDTQHPDIIRVNLPHETFSDVRVGTLVGEICYNLRAALDYLVFQLARHDSGVMQNGTQFPIEDTEKGFRHRKKIGWLQGINTAHVAAIERLQPYTGCNWTKRLRNISNPDKHQQLVEIRGHAALTPHARIDNPRFDLIDAPIRRAHHPMRGEVDVKVYISGNVQFTDGASVTETLDEIKLKVAEAIELFKPEF